jgi:hypothetical protein
MARKPKGEEFYWPLGQLGRGDEIQDLFPEEAKLLGILTILWNNQEENLGRIFTHFFPKRDAFAAAIWNRQPTHHAKRSLLALALDHADLTERHKAILGWIIEQTKKIADRRNELVHGIYVVHGKNDQLFAKTRPPNSSKPPKYQKSSAEAIQATIAELEDLIGVTEGFSTEMLVMQHPEAFEELLALGRSLREKREAQSQESPQNGSLPPSARQRRQSKRKPPPQSSEE